MSECPAYIRQRNVELCESLRVARMKATKLQMKVKRLEAENKVLTAKIRELFADLRRFRR